MTFCIKFCFDLVETTVISYWGFVKTTLSFRKQILKKISPDENIEILSKIRIETDVSQNDNRQSEPRRDETRSQFFSSNYFSSTWVRVKPEPQVTGGSCYQEAPGRLCMS
jgi:hypothetical protein